MTDLPLQLNGATALRGGFQLGPVDLQMAPGTVHGLVGANGAGKTTLLLLVLGLLRPREGTVRVAGELTTDRSRRFLANVGYVPDDPKVIVEELSAGEYWAMAAGLIERARGAARASDIRRHAAELATAIEFHPGRARIATFSHGMRVQCQLIAALAGRPSLLLLDEVHNGLDPIVAEQADALIRSAVHQGAAALIATHDLRWCTSIADRVTVLSAGKASQPHAIEHLAASDARSADRALLALMQAGRR
jgi:ABC-2 type transport system ATP-binding protein